MKIDFKLMDKSQLLGSLTAFALILTPALPFSASVRMRWKRWL